MQLPSIENLRCFDAATKAPSFRVAARAVGLTPTAFGQRINYFRLVFRRDDTRRGLFTALAEIFERYPLR